ncbi:MULTISPECIES: phospho-N-acetylmuramoyl-pentapeptide-transferase [Bacillales]|uniref:Phospho-N-acetylmuramoyl-pentapeptide-transferase n=1 Tax=Lysinibacillus louembei TaxID=1470088 RepID=A0ABZ0RXP3_9BACI|nr:MULTISPECIES: phospho-N-acetylmuramoyl-pentapeptide-transferase [Bacillales]MCT6924013.1 phospho-N-acetylmuramoyl-pentapeptide-transferase [Metasolibacillus sp.]MCT6940129.1 phospho-N-acetylmuramoyl-pentapeptide-transferase [Metasolibacillus sp.]WPK12046.1 phospho-N-acetylmuramoyl-pentapeptide-transferase [Lysinibacillus louembei]
MKLATTLTILTTAFILTVVLAPIAIPLLRRLKFGQSIREEGPQSHMKKAGTPTMGGIIYLVAIIVTTLVTANIFNLFTTHTVVLLLVLIGFGVIGFLDDGIKVIFKRNLGLTSLQKLLGQIIIAIAAFMLLRLGTFDTAVAIPFTDYSIDFGLFYVAFLIFWLVGFSNAVNLTDGLDGLVAGTASIAFAAFAVIALFNEQADIALVAFAITGALLGFLIFNINPAKVFMGDTGSLALGGALAMISILIKAELLLLLVGLVFVIETLSVILQVGSFKLRKKRIFKMSPIHHHFELSGWSEWKVVLVFWFTGLVVALIAVIMEAFL